LAHFVPRGTALSPAGPGLAPALGNRAALGLTYLGRMCIVSVGGFSLSTIISL